MYRTVKKVVLAPNGLTNIEHGLNLKPRIVMVQPKETVELSLEYSDDKRVIIRNRSNVTTECIIYFDCFHSINNNPRDKTDYKDTVLFNLSVTPSQVQPGDYVIRYVDPLDGDDNNTGVSWEEAWKTINKALDEFKDTSDYVIMVKDGLVEESIRRNITANHNIYIVGQEKKTDKKPIFRWNITNGAGNEIKVVGNATTQLIIGDYIQVCESVYADDYYQVVDLTYDPQIDITVITVNKNLPTIISSGYVYNYVYLHFETYAPTETQINYSVLITRLDNFLPANFPYNEAYLRMFTTGSLYNYVQYQKIIKYESLNDTYPIYKFYLLGGLIGRKYLSSEQIYILEPTQILDYDIVQANTILYKHNGELSITFNGNNKSLYLVNLKIGIEQNGDMRYIMLFENNIIPIGSTIFYGQTSYATCNLFLKDIFIERERTSFEIMKRIYNIDYDASWSYISLCAYSLSYINRGLNIVINNRRSVNINVYNFGEQEYSTITISNSSNTVIRDAYTRKGCIRFDLSTITLTGRIYIGSYLRILNQSLIIDNTSKNFNNAFNIIINGEHYCMTSIIGSLACLDSKFYLVSYKLVILLDSNSYARSSHRGLNFINSDVIIPKLVYTKTQYSLDTCMYIENSKFKINESVINIDASRYSATPSHLIIGLNSDLNFGQSFRMNVKQNQNNAVYLESSKVKGDIFQINSYAYLLQEDPNTYLSFNNSTLNINALRLEMNDYNDRDWLDMSNSSMRCSDILLSANETMSATSNSYLSLVNSQLNVTNNLHIQETLNTTKQESGKPYINFTNSQCSFSNLVLDIYKQSIANIKRINIQNSTVIIDQIGYHRNQNGNPQNTTDIYLSMSKLKINKGQIYNLNDTSTGNNAILNINESNVILGLIKENPLNLNIDSGKTNQIILSQNSTITIQGQVLYATGKVTFTDVYLFKFINSSIFYDNGSLDFVNGDYSYPVLYFESSILNMNCQPTIANDQYNTFNLNGTTYVVRVTNGSQLHFKNLDPNIDKRYWTTTQTETKTIFLLGSLSTPIDYPALNTAVNDIQVVTPSISELALITNKQL